MTDEEKAEEITKRDFCNKLCGEKECSYTVQACPMAQYVYLGSFLGLAEGRKEVREHETTYVTRLHYIEKENAELKKEISVLLSCSNCQENKGGYVCEKEYNDKCLAQKIQYIKELKEENAELKAQIEKMKSDVQELSNNKYYYLSQDTCKELLRRWN